MGVVKKNVFKNTLISYIGMVVGYVNLVLLYPVYLSSEEYGLFNLLGSLAILYSLIASLGIPNIISRYFVSYRTEDKQHNGFMHWAVGVALIGFMVSTALFLIFKPVIIANYVDKSPLFIEYYYYLIPLAFFTISFNFLEMTGRVIYQSIFSNFLKDILIRLLTTAAILLMAFKVIDFQTFIILYILINGLVSFMLLISLMVSGNFSVKLSKRKFSEIKAKEIMRYGMYTLISTAVYVFLQKVDVVMLSSMAGLSVQGVYSFFFNIALVIGIPAQALSRTTYQIVTDSWKTKNMTAIADVYYKTSIIQMVVGTLLFIGVIINKENLIGIIHKKEYGDQFNIFIVIGLGFLVDTTGGLNTAIISASHKYRLVTGFVIVSSIFCIFLNYIFIPKYGGLGAGLAYLVTITLFNFGNWFYIKYRFKLQPFNYKHLIVLAIAVVGFLWGNYLWRMPNIYLDLAVRSASTAVIYGLLCYVFNVSADLNEKVHVTLAKLGIRH